VGDLTKLPVETLIQAYEGERNPFNLKNRHEAAGMSAGAELRRRGIDISGLPAPSNTGGVVHHPGLRGIGEDLAPILKVAAPIAALAIPGLGPIAAGAIAAGGHEVGDVLQGRNALKALPGSLATGALAGAGRFGLNKLAPRGLLGLGGAPGGGAAASGATESLADIGNAGTAAGGGSGIVSDVGSTLGGIGKGVLGYIKKNPLDAARIGLAGLNTITAAQAQGRANKAIGQGLGEVQGLVSAPPNIDLPALPYNPYGPTTPGAPNRAAAAARAALASGR